MSFILDALKKSESDRQRQSGPALFEVKVAPPRNGLPLWAIGLGALLAVNLVIVAWVLLRRSSEPAVAAQSPPAAAASPQPLPPAQQPPGYATAPPGTGYPGTLGSPNPAAQQGQTPLNTAPSSGTGPGGPLGQTAGLTQPAQTGAGQAGTPTTAQQPAGSPSQGPAEPPQAETQADKLTPDDYAPATDPGPMPGFGNHVTKATSAGVPLYQDAALAPGAHIPELRLDLHVFAAKPQDRFVMINMRKLREGDTLPTEGVHVESITPEGAILSKDGTRFLLPRQ